MQILEGLYWYFQYAAAEISGVRDGMVQPHLSLAGLLLGLWESLDESHWERWSWANENGFEYPMTFLNYDPLDIINNNPASAAYSMSQDDTFHGHSGIKQEMNSQQDHMGTGTRDYINSLLISNPSRASMSSTSSISWSVPNSTPGKYHPSKGDILLQHLPLLLFHPL